MNDDDLRAFGRNGYVWEGLRDAAHGFGGKIVAILLILTALFIVWHVVPAWLSRDNPPVSCQLVGGTWSPWSGWQC